MIHSLSLSLSLSLSECERERERIDKRRNKYEKFDLIYLIQPISLIKRAVTYWVIIRKPNIASNQLSLNGNNCNMKYSYLVTVQT